jgi:hypothetical protein
MVSWLQDRRAQSDNPTLRALPARRQRQLVDDETANVLRQAIQPVPAKSKEERRKDSLRRHLIDVHLTRAHEGIICIWAACCNVPKFKRLLNSWRMLLTCTHMISKSNKTSPKETCTNLQRYFLYRQHKRFSGIMWAVRH